jgi:hypothetical protein
MADQVSYGAIDSLDVDHVRCPVLLIHGNATINYSYTAHSALADSTLSVMERGTHLARVLRASGGRDVQEQAR